MVPTSDKCNLNIKQTEFKYYLHKIDLTVAGLNGVHVPKRKRKHCMVHIETRTFQSNKWVIIKQLKLIKIVVLINLTS